METFQELDCWKKSALLRRKILKIVQTFPKEERYRLVDQIIRASRSVTANIAEGYGRFHYQEYIQFCRQARGSLYELLDHLIVSHEENFIDEAQLKELKTDIMNCIAVLNGFINYLQKAKTS
ncbi:four helix bundle protein [Pseudochryseolinea flava]|uniref:Four helix bundle protein n=1 Tax=Pseudochryseolinea flava TaxID=2059302 RepID=A0A364XYH6_9BACT|nr:four helix bundle protein [Pseudochryseolinea flava]RAV99045.1 four helix bundle protein [Pseudochryseolinea flava]